MLFQRLIIAAMLLSGCAAGFAQSGSDAGRRAVALEEVMPPDAGWIAYRDAYRQMIRFEKYGKPKHLIQDHFQVVPRERGIPLDGVQLTLSGPATHLNLPLDAVGRAVFPFAKSAYDDNARLVLNRKGSLYLLRERVSIVPRADGVYEAAELRAACEQALDYLRYSGTPGMQDKRCAGVRFSYPLHAPEAPVRVRGDEHPAKVLAAEEAGPFPDESALVMRTVTFRFSDWPEKSQVITPNAPAAIAPVFR